MKRVVETFLLQATQLTQLTQATQATSYKLHITNYKMQLQATSYQHEAKCN